VQLLTDKYRTEGVSKGAIGYIIEVYADTYEVEFSDSDGITIAQVVVQPNEVSLAEALDQPNLRVA
jgi:hypothetical protein